MRENARMWFDEFTRMDQMYHDNGYNYGSDEVRLTLIAYAKKAAVDYALGRVAYELVYPSSVACTEFIDYDLSALRGS